VSVIKVIVPANGARRWQAEIVDRIKAAGYGVTIVHGAPAQREWLLDLILRVECVAFSLSGPRMIDAVSIAATGGTENTDLTLDLTGLGSTGLAIKFDGEVLAGLAALVAAGELPDVRMEMEGVVVGQARPMIDNRISLARGLEDVLARAVTLCEAALGRALAGQCESLDMPVPEVKAGLAVAYFGALLPRLISEVLRRQKYRSAHWRVGYRFVDGPGVAEAGDMGGVPWSVLADDGMHFYADPFAFEWQGRQFIFVEDLDHSVGKAIISVSEVDAAGVAGRPRPVLAEPHHLSYPQVFARDGAVWMLPEASASGQLVLYRAEAFPDTWARHAVLVSDRALSDATLIEHDGWLWLFATDRDGAGSTSDTMVVYRAAQLEGPWLAHKGNPIVIDRTRARPGGAFIARGDRLVLPVQEGTLGYGGGLGLVEIKILNEDEVKLSLVKAIRAEGSWPYPKIHTLNRAGRLEVVDGIAEVLKR
jgi:hypothetical protein